MTRLDREDDAANIKALGSRHLRAYSQAKPLSPLCGDCTRSRIIFGHRDCALGLTMGLIVMLRVIYTYLLRYSVSMLA